MADVLASAPAAQLEAPIEERVISWIEDEPTWSLPYDGLGTIPSWQPPPEERLIASWRGLSPDSPIRLVTAVLSDYVDRHYAERIARRAASSAMPLASAAVSSPDSASGTGSRTTISVARRGASAAGMSGAACPSVNSGAAGAGPALALRRAGPPRAAPSGPGP